MAPDEPPLRGVALLAALVAKGVEFVVVGGVAVQAHGYLRATGDLDIVPRPTLLNLSRLAEVLSELEATPVRAAARVDLTDPHLLGRLPMLPLLTRFGRLDLLNLEHVAGAPASFDALSERALTIDLDGVLVPVAGLDDLVRMKRAAGRPHDLTDIAALTRSDDELRSELDEST